MRFLLPGISLVSATCLLSGCGDPPNKTKDRFEKDNYFTGAEVTMSLDELGNEMADTRTDFLRSFAKDDIPWQKWDKDLLGIAKKTQKPVFAYVGSSLGGSSRAVANEIASTESLRKLVSENAVCTVIDIHSFPEIGSMGYHLSNEIKRATAFPMIIWLSHEGSPLAWIPIGSLSGRELDVVITNAAAMVEDIWSRSSQYAVENSRADNEARQKRFDLALKKPEDTEAEKRDELFRRNARQLSALYSFGDKDLDYIGGLIPTSSLNLLALGSNSKILTDEVRERCRQAAKEVSAELINGALKDHLDGSYFYARRTSDWSLPSFSKNLPSQARVASTLITVGTILSEDAFVQEGLQLLKIIEERWLAKSISCLSPLGEEDTPGKFVWDFETLEKVLEPNEMALATAAFSLQKSGNIPAAVDPLGDYYQKNSVRRKVPLSEIAGILNITEPEAQTTLQSVREKMLGHRNKNVTFIKETIPVLTEFALVLKAQLARSAHSRDAGDLATAATMAERILKEFRDTGKGLSRHPTSSGFHQARCTDYASLSLALLNLYQQTMNEKWLGASVEILDEAIEKLKAENGLLTETTANERIIPLRQHDLSMIFGESSIGVLDHALSHAFALTGNETYGEILKLHSLVIAPMAGISTVNHTDFVASCALGETSLLAVLDGDVTNAGAKEILHILNSPKHSPYLTIRPRNGADPLSSLEGLGVPPSSGTPSVTLVRGKEILGRVENGTELTQLLDRTISSRSSE